MKKNLLILLGLFIALPTFARDFVYTYEGQTLIYTVLDETAKTCFVAENSDISGSLIIPETASDGSNEYSIIIIGNRAFSDCSGLTSVTIPNSVTIIGDWAFFCCSGLTSVIIPNSVTSIGGFAFYGCSGLTSVTIGDSVTHIMDSAFSNCTGLTSVSIGKSVDFIGECTFSNCGLTEVSIPETVTHIGGNAFECIGLTKAEFANIESLCNIYFINCLSNPLYYAKHLYIGGEEVINLVIPESVTTIGDNAFVGCSGLNSVTIGDSVTEMGSYAFYECKGLTSVAIGNSVTSIGNNAFRDCIDLASVALGRSLSHIDYSVFSDCCSIQTLYILDGYDTLYFDYYDGGGEYFGVVGNKWLLGIKELYLGRNVSYISGQDVQFPSVAQLEIGNQITEIGESMFCGCTDLTAVALGNGLTTIGSNAFSGCSLTEVVVPPSVETIGAYAFADNENLSTVIMGHKVTSIGDMAYNGCPVEDVYITAQNPPTADDELFSQYTGELWVTNSVAVTAYRNAPACWNLFSAYAMIEPEEIKIDGAQTIDAAPGDTIRLTATISPDNVTLPQIFWRSTNPAIATVYNDGVVVVRGVEPEISTYAQGDDDYTEGGCRIIAESLYADAPIAMVAINSELADLEGIIIDRKESQTIDYAEPYDVYNMQGVWLGRSVDSVVPGFYILRQGSKAAKILK